MLDTALSARLYTYMLDTGLKFYTVYIYVRYWSELYTKMLDTGLNSILYTYILDTGLKV